MKVGGRWWCRQWVWVELLAVAAEVRESEGQKSMGKRESVCEVVGLKGEEIKA